MALKFFAVAPGLLSFILGVLLDHRFFSNQQTWAEYLGMRWIILLFYGLLSVLLSIFCYTLTRLLNFAHNFETLLDERFYRVLHLYPHQLLADKAHVNGHSVSEALRDLVENYKAKRAMALEIAIESFRDILLHGFIVFECSVERYVDYIKMGIASSSAYVFASCLVRPFWFILDGQTHPSCAAYRMGPEERGGHLRILRRARNIKRLRLMILTSEEVALIVADALLACKVQSPPIPLKRHYENVPEIEWFTNIVCKHPSQVKLLWARHSPILDGPVLQDRMIFDGEFSLQFDFTDEAMALGHIRLTWGDMIPQPIRSAVPQLVRDTRNIENGVKVFHVAGEAAYVCFTDFLAAVDSLNPEAIHYVTQAWRDLTDDQRRSFGLAEAPTSLEATYRTLLGALNEGRVIYPDMDLSIRVQNREGQPLDYTCNWRRNSALLRLGT